MICFEHIDMKHLCFLTSTRSFNQVIGVTNYSCFFGKCNERVLVRVSVCVCVFLQDNSKRNPSRNTKFEYVVVYGNSSDEFAIELHWIKVKVSVGVQNFIHLPQYKLKGPTFQLW